MTSGTAYTGLSDRPSLFLARTSVITKLIFLHRELNASF